MPKCSVSCCKNNSTTSSLKKDGVSFHIFPKDPLLKDVWAKFCNKRQLWIPKRTSAICSSHFQPSDFRNLLNGCGSRKLVENAIPTLKPKCSCVSHVIPTAPCYYTPGTVGSAPPIFMTPQAGSSSQQQEIQYRITIEESVPNTTPHSESISLSSVRERRMQDEIDNQKKKIKRLRSNNTYFKSRVASLEAASLSNVRERRMKNMIESQRRKINQLQSSKNYFKRRVANLQAALQRIGGQKLIEREEKNIHKIDDEEKEIIERKCKESESDFAPVLGVDGSSMVKVEANPLDEIKPDVVPSVSAAKPSTSAKMEAEEVIPDVTVKNEIIDIEEERLIKIKTEAPDYLTPTHPAKTCENTQITVKLESLEPYELKDNSYLIERDDIVDNPKEVESFSTPNIPVSIKQENVEAMVTNDYTTFDDGGSMDSSEAAALANVETCLQDDINIKTENGVHLEDAKKEEFISTEVKTELGTTTELNSSNQITPDIPEPSKYSFVMKIPSDVMHKIDQLTSSLSDGDNDNAECDSYLNAEASDYNDSNLNEESTESSLLVESEKNEIIGNTLNTIQCPKCPKTCATAKNLKAHLKIHQTIDNYRNGRKRGLETKRKNIFKRQQLLQTEEHRSQDSNPSNQTITVENKEGYNCTCGKKFQRKTRMESCLRSHGCDTPQDKAVRGSFNLTTDTNSALEASNLSEPIGLNSFQLNSITGNVLSLEQEAYNMMKEKKITQCPKCTKTFYAKSKLKAHLKEVHKTVLNFRNRRKNDLESKKRNECRNMKALLQRSNEYESQESCSNQQDIKVENKGGYECTCGKTFQRKTRMQSCLRSHDCCESEKYYCMTCLKDFKSKDELALHRKRLHRKKFPCKFCPTDYATRKKLFKHLQIHQKVDQMEYKVIQEVVKEKKKLSCLLCSNYYGDLSDLKIHVMTEHKGPYSCPHCKNTFPKINDFGNHTKAYHPEVGGQKVLDVIEAFSRLTQEWKCEECGLQFLEADKLALHQVEEHNPDLKKDHQFQCPDCRRVFISQKGLTSHRRIHHSVEISEPTKVEVPGILCLECRKMCKDMAALTSHMRFHSPDRKYPCKFCDFRFATPEKRKTHADIHTGDMKYVCFICEYQCSSENRLKKHKQSLKHANIREYLLTGKPLIEESTSKDEYKKKAKKGNSSKDVESDNSESESDGEEVCCDICGEKFPSESEMLEHKETHPFIEIPNADNQPTRIFFK